MNAAQRTFKYLKLICLCLLIGAYFLWLFGIRIFNLPKVDVPLLNKPFFYYAVSLILFQLNTLVMQLIIFGMECKKELLCSLITIPLWIIGIFVIKVQTSFPFVVCYILLFLLIFRKNKYKINFLRALIVVIIVCIYQPLSLLVKTNIFNLTFNYLNTIDMLLFSIDLFLFYGILYLTFNKGRYNNYVGMVEMVLRRIFKPIRKNKKETQQVNLAGLTLIGKIIFFSVVIAAQLFQFAIILLIAKINNRVIEVVVLAACLIPLRTFILRDTLHAKTFLGCTAVTCFTFWMLMRFTLPLSISIFSGVIVTCLLVLVMYYIATNVDVFNLETCTKEELIERCRVRKLSKLLTERAIKLYADKQSIEDIAFSENVEIDSIYKAKARIKDRLS